MVKLKTIIVGIGVLLLILSAVTGFLSFRSLSDMRSAESFEDKGVYVFSPYRVLPVQVKNNSANARERRMNPTKTVYMVYYRTTDGSGYQWSTRALTRKMGQEMVDADVGIARRVLNIPEEHSYITIEPEQTAESYTSGLRQKHILVLCVSAGYILMFVLMAWRYSIACRS